MHDVSALVFSLSSLNATTKRCDLCNPGFFAGADGAVACNACLPGHYSAMYGGNSFRSCLPCELGYFNPTAGQSACQKCAAGQNCPIGSAGPVPDIPRQPLLQFQPAQARGGRMRGEG